MSETRLGRDNERPQGSSIEGESVRMEQNPPRQNNPEGQAEPLRVAPEAPIAQNPLNPSMDYLLSMKEMFEQLTASLKKENSATTSTPTPS
ncbi:hypothetical protein V6N12_057346 [Hibiscus sabdariffa]|uniref:Uncharacterized protein n=1 Tax=Hibiscus sabdariffa TaxID=183260 RepID=A0ABR2DBK5_9ROSI